MTASGGDMYDGENRLVWTSGYRYVYDGNGERVEKCQAASATTACPTSGTNGKLYWKGTGSDPLAETDLAGNPTEEYIFFNGTRIARRDVSSTGATIALHYYFSDHLGTHAVVENATGTQSEQDIDYYPYGGQQNDYSTTPVAQNYKFNGKERDGESGLDNFGARYDTSNLGRFMMPDWAVKPATVPYANFGNPQSLNLYSYVENNPTTVGDPDGHCPPQTSAQQQSSGCPQLTVTVKKDAEPHVMHGQIPKPNIAKVGTTTTIKVTDAKGAAVVGASVKESPVTTNNLTQTKVNNLANPEPQTTSAKGTIKDVVAENVVKEPTSTGEIQDHVNSTPYDRTTVQTLTITTQGAGGQTCTCSATYSEHMTNVGADGKLNGPTSSGVNYNLDIDPEVVHTTPQ